MSRVHFNPAVTLAFAVSNEPAWTDAAIYIVAQVAGVIVGIWVGHLMFEFPIWQLSLTERTGAGQSLGEGVATFDLLATIFGLTARTPSAVPYAVGL